ncbi:MAG: recombinase family protein [Alphaproteobacteria bacterium]|nr:recombinase family protein [Alphaproteobacteria bacterium]
MKIGYARTSTIEQQAGFDAQMRDLEAAGCEKVFSEQVSSIGQREQLEAALDFVRSGDTLVVTKLDRLARSTADLLKIEEQLRAKGAALLVLDLDLDTSSATGKLLFTMVAAIGAFERELMLERQREGIAKAKAEGKYKGRAPTARAKTDQVLKMKSKGVGASQIAKELGIGRASVYRILAG